MHSTLLLTNCISFLSASNLTPFLWIISTIDSSYAQDNIIQLVIRTLWHNLQLCPCKNLKLDFGNYWTTLWLWISKLWSHPGIWYNDIYFFSRTVYMCIFFNAHSWVEFLFWQDATKLTDRLLDLCNKAVDGPTTTLSVSHHFKHLQRLVDDRWAS